MHPRRAHPVRAALVVVDLGYGDQGKGAVTDFLVRDRGAHTVVRYNGGAQAGHNVVTPDGRHHTFSQFGAGSFVPGVSTVLTQAVAIQPWAMAVEASHLERVGVSDAFSRTLVSRDAVVITPFHGAANRLRERARGDDRHGSVGMGVGEAVSDARTLPPDLVLRAGDLSDEAVLRARLRRVQDHKRAVLADVLVQVRGNMAARDDVACLDDPGITDLYVDHLEAFNRRARVVDAAAVRAHLGRSGTVVLEGAQGVLLDEWRGFHPYTTWSPCTDHPALEVLADNGWDGDITRLGVVRAYATRHGAGPFVTEDSQLTARLLDPHNGVHPWQGGFRVGWFDAVATRYAIAVCARIDALAVTCIDRLQPESAWRLASAYLIDGASVTALPVGPHEDLVHQSALTARLLQSSPVYDTTTVTARADAHVDAIAAACGVPVRLVSHGTTAADKHWRTD